MPDRNDQPVIIEGFENAEDLAFIPGTDWIITSAYSDTEIPHARSFFVNSRTHEIRPAYPDNCTFDLDQERFGAIDPPEATRFHGLDVGVEGGVITLYQVNHPWVAGPLAGKGRESVEVFEIEMTADGPALRWRGAVVAPPWVNGNDVCALPRGGFGLTNSYYRGAEGLEMAFSGKSSGHVLEWRDRTEGWVIVEGTDLNSTNGIAISPDGEFYFVASWASKKMWRISRSDPHGSRMFVDTGAMIDNVTWTRDGFLLLAGHIGEPATQRRAFESGHDLATPFKAIRLDPRTMEIETIISETRRMCLATTILQVGANEYWVGTVHSRQLLVYTI